MAAAWLWWLRRNVYDLRLKNDGPRCECSPPHGGARTAVAAKQVSGVQRAAGAAEGNRMETPCREMRAACAAECKALLSSVVRDCCMWCACVLHALVAAAVRRWQRP